MNKKLLLLASLACYLFTAGQAQNISSWFTAKVVGNKIWQISDHGSDNMYLVEGASKALLIDNGLGTADLQSFIKNLTSKPVIVAITHGHPDHAGSDYQFEKVFIHQADSEAAKAFNTPESRAGSAKAMQGNTSPAENELYKGKVFETKMVPIKEGDIIDLGDRRIEVIETPGHTPGGICLLDIKNKILFTGDNNNVLVWLFLPTCKPLHEYLATLEKQQSRMTEYTTLMPGHGEPLPADFINDQIACVKSILGGKCESKEYKSFAGNALVCTTGRASVAYNPDNL